MSTLARGIPAGDVKAWPATVEGVRDSCLRLAIVDIEQEGAEGVDLPAEDGRELVARFAQEAAAAGRIIDAGHIPNAVIKAEAVRVGGLVVGGHLGMPFSDPWLLYHTWEGGVAVSLVTGINDRGLFSVFEMIPINSQAVGRTLVLGDMIRFSPLRTEGRASYDVQGRPSYLRRAMAQEHGTPFGDVLRMAGANCLDPVLAVIGMMATDGVQVETIAPSAKLSKARKRSGKPPIPSFQRVHSAPYVTAILARGQRREGEARGGSHASPVGHIRRGHVRHLATGKTTWVRDCLVNVNKDSPVMRSHYVLKDGAGRPHLDMTGAVP